jgi:retron-type reverse transcriptase
MTYKTSFLGLTKKGRFLDGLDGNWVFELVKCICKGQNFILPALKVLISKPNKKKKRPLGLASPREKIVQHFK